jgi:hypothetical protein
MKTARKTLVVVLSVVTLASCGKKEAVPTTTTSSTSTTTSTTTTVAPTTTTIPVAPIPTDVELTVPSTVPASRKTGNGPCVDPDGSQYCVWGTQPVQLTVNNSRKATMNTGARQGFTAVKKRMTSVEILLESTSIGALVPATETTAANDVCVRVTLMTELGLPIATTGLVTSSTKGIRQQLTVPLASALVPGALHKIQLEKGPACWLRDLSTYVAMSSNYKYPSKYGRMSIDGKSSDGSLWARID